jgi:hypothetical protein
MAARSNRFSVLSWRKGSASAGESACVEVARLGRSLLIRDSRDVYGEPVALTGAQWRSLVVRIRNGDLDLG